TSLHAATGPAVSDQTSADVSAGRVGRRGALLCTVHAQEKPPDAHPGHQDMGPLETAPRLQLSTNGSESILLQGPADEAITGHSDDRKISVSCPIPHAPSLEAPILVSRVRCRRSRAHVPTQADSLKNLSPKSHWYCVQKIKETRAITRFPCTHSKNGL